MPGSRARRVGRVASDRADKTIVVEVESVRRHRLYKKPVRVRRKFVAHDPHNTCRTGDVVQIEESRPMSRRKRWRLVEVIERTRLTDEERQAAFSTGAPEHEINDSADSSRDA
ncbi:MAG: 30S ribosomal protein S17 [Chloroflexi bacterium]|nr:30S ribosomal protein S17 [Chloroflexota bacterium]MCY3958039.1 30S ribosomal protein S17 [Chloroflexota bacterium]